MDQHRLARLLGFGRILVGTTLVLAPGVAGVWAGPAAGQRGVQLITRAAGVRDLLLGWRTVHALDGPSSARAPLVDGAIADAVDLGAVLVAFRHLPRRARLALVSASATGVALGWRLSRALP